MLLTLGAADSSGVAMFFVVVLGGALTAVGILLYCERKRRVEAERQLAGQARVAQQAGSERDALMFNQHRRMNELATLKLEAEVALLQGQVKARGDDDDRLHAAKEFHELSVEKTRLEIDSLRLHIAEQRKRIDDWGLGGGG